MGFVILGDSPTPLKTIPPETTSLPKTPLRGNPSPDPTWGPDLNPNPNPNRPTERKLSEN